MIPKITREMHLMAAISVMMLYPVGPVQAQEVREVNVLLAGEDTCSLYGVHVARELGFFESEGLQVNLLPSATTIPYVAFLTNGDADVIMLDSAQVYQMANAKVPGAVVYEAYQFAPEGIVVMADSPIQGLSDLRGKTIGLASDRDQITTIVALNSVGMDISEVETVVVGDSGPVMAGALSSGTIAAFAGGSSDRSGIEAAGVAIRNITPFEVSDNPGNSFVVSTERKEEVRPIVEGFLRGWAMGTIAGVIDTKAIMSICRKVFPEEWENPEVGAAMVEESVFSLNLPRAKLYGELRPWVWEKVQEPYVALGEIDGRIDPATFLDDSFIAAANDFTTEEVAMAIIRWKESNADILIP